MPAGAFLKHPVEVQPRGIDMQGKLPSGATVTQAQVAATDLTTGSDATSTVLQSPMAQVTNTAADVVVRAGINGHRYQLDFTIRDSLNHVYRETLIMVVRNS